MCTKTYVIEATIAKIKSGDVQLKGCDKYRFDASDGKKYWNIFEEVTVTSNEEIKTVDLAFEKQEKPFKITNLDEQMKNLLGYAFCEKKKLKFELDENCTAILGVSYGSSC